MLYNLQIISLFLCLLASSLVSYGTESNSTSEKAKDKDPEVILPKKKTIRNAIVLKGFIEDPDATVLSIDTQNWSDLRVSTPPIHGKTVSKGEILLEIDTEKIRNHIQVLSHDLNILDLNKEILLAEIKLAEELAPLEKAEIDRFENYVKEDYNRFNKVYLPFDKKSATMSLKSSEQYLANAAEELNQLKKMLGISRKTMHGSTSDGFGKHLPCFTKHRKNHGQFKRKQNHWCQ